MPRRSSSGVRGLYKKHGARCENAGESTACDCPWYAKYRGVVKGLAQWARQDVDPHRTAHALVVLNRLKVAVDNRTYRSEGEHVSLGSGQLFKDFIEEWREHYAKEYRLTSNSLPSMLRIVEAGLGTYTLERLAGASLEIERWLNREQKKRGWVDNTWNRYYELLSTLCVRATKWRSNGVPRMGQNPMIAIERRVGTKRKFRVRVEESIEDRLFAACDVLDQPQAARGRVLTAEKAADIRARVAAGERQLDVAAAFGISPATCCAIVNGTVWNPERYRSARRGYMMRLRLMMAFDAGVRREEMLKIQLKHVNFTPITVHVDGHARELLVIEVQSKGEKATGEKEFVYAGTDRLVAALRTRREELQGEPNGYVFGTPEGRRQKDFHRSWQRLFKVAGLEYGRYKGLVWHTLRHEFCSRTAENTGDPVVAQELARHKDLRTTQGYLHARRSRVLAAAVALNRRD